MKRLIIYASLFLVVYSCTPTGGGGSPASGLLPSDTIGYPIQNLSNDGSTTLTNVRFSTHFINWLQENQYDVNMFAPSQIAGSSFGGKQTDSTPINHHPVIFIHGNSDKAIGVGFGQSGWTRSINYFKQKGYNNAELYATTWGDANALTASQKYHSKEYILHIRKFIEAVLLYTGAEKVDIITHSMGVTLTRKAIKGGNASDLLAGGSYSIGNSLTTKVDVFVGIAGANQGLVSCYTTGPVTPTCGATNGFYPGTAMGGVGLSIFLKELNSTTRFEGNAIYSIWSSVDEIVGYGCIVYGKNTCAIAGQNGQKTFNSIPYGHFGVKDNTMHIQYEMVKNHRVI